MGHVAEFASGVVGPRLGLSPAAADATVGVAARMASVMVPVPVGDQFTSWPVDHLGTRSLAATGWRRGWARGQGRDTH